MDGLQVDPERLRKMARVYEDQADRLAREISRFSSQTRLHDEAFGLLGEARDAHHAYVGLVNSTVAVLNDAVTELRKRADHLRATAAAYELADELSSG